MNGLARKVLDKSKKVVSLVTALATFAGCSAHMGPSKTLEEELNHNPNHYEVVDSKISTTVKVEHRLPDGINLNLTEQEINFDPSLDTGEENPTFTYKISEGKLKFHSKDGRVIDDVIDFWGDKFGHFVPIEELRGDLIDVATGKTSPEDLVLFEGNQKVTIRDMKEMLLKINEFSKTTKRGDYFNYKIDLPGNANLENLTITTQTFRASDGSEIEVIHGLKADYKINARAYFDFGARWPDSITLGEFAENNFPEYKKWISLLSEEISNIKTKKLIINAEAGTYLFDELTLSQFAQFEIDGTTIGAMQKDSKIRERSSRVYADFIANPENPSVEGGFGREYSELEKKINSGLIYVGKKIKNLSLMVGFEAKDTWKRLKQKMEGTRAKVGKNGWHYEDFDKTKIIETETSKSEIIYGVAEKYPLLFIPKIDTELSIYTSMTNYPEEERTFGGAINSRLVNIIGDTNGNYKGYLTLLGNRGKNPLKEYFDEEIRSGINPLKDEIGDIRERELNRNLDGLFLEASKVGDETKVGAVIAFSGESYLDFEATEGTNTNEYSVGAAIGPFGIDANYGQYKDPINGMHGESAELGFSYVLPNGWMSILDFQGEPDEPTRPKRIFLGISGETYFLQ